MKGRDLVLGVIASLIAGVIWTLVKRGARSGPTSSSSFKPWYPER